MTLSKPEWENGDNVVSLAQKRKEMAERIEQERVEYNISGETTSVAVLCCPCGCEALTLYSDSEYLYAECLECGEPMLVPVLAFMQGEY